MHILKLIPWLGGILFLILCMQSQPSEILKSGGSIVQIFVLPKRNLNCHSPRPQHHQPVQERSSLSPLTLGENMAHSAADKAAVRSALGERGAVVRSQDLGVGKLGFESWLCHLVAG